MLTQEEVITKIEDAISKGVNIEDIKLTKDNFKGISYII